jgi:hypothetical protein
MLAESLRTEAVLDVPLTLRHLHRLGVSGTVDGQAGAWLLIDFTCPDGQADTFAAQLSHALADGAWYADFATDDTEYVVFAGSTDGTPARTPRLVTRRWRTPAR